MNSLLFKEDGAALVAADDGHTAWVFAPDALAVPPPAPLAVRVPGAGVLRAPALSSADVALAASLPALRPMLEGRVALCVGAGAAATACGAVRLAGCRQALAAVDGDAPAERQAAGRTVRQNLCLDKVALCDLPTPAVARGGLVVLSPSLGSSVSGLTELLAYGGDAAGLVTVVPQALGEAARGLPTSLSMVLSPSSSPGWLLFSSLPSSLPSSPAPSPAPSAAGVAPPSLADGSEESRARCGCFEPYEAEAHLLGVRTEDLDFDKCPQASVALPLYVQAAVQHAEELFSDLDVGDALQLSLQDTLDLGIDRGEGFTYGEALVPAAWHVLSAARPLPGETFLDLGCGKGSLLTAAAELFAFAEVRGVELLPSLAQAAQEHLQAFAERVQPVLPLDRRHTRLIVESGDMRALEAWRGADVVYVASTVFAEAFMLQLAAAADTLRKGARVLTLKKVLPSAQYSEVSRHLVTMSWGAEVVVVQERV